MDNKVEHPTVLDTDQQRVGEIYARSLLAIGQRGDRVDELLGQLRAFNSAVAKLPAFRLLLESPRISFDEKSSLLDKVLGQRASPEFINFVKVLTRKGRFECLPAVQVSANRLCNEYRGRVAATLVTAEPISDESRQYAVEQLTKSFGREIDLTCRTDPSIIAGAVVRVGDTVYDGSAQMQLRRARTTAIQRAHQEIRDSFSRFAKDN
jgi:F-type H+-transporting ATPase subunit delta